MAVNFKCINKIIAKLKTSFKSGLESYFTNLFTLLCISKITSHKARQMKKMTWAAAELGIAVVENKKKMSKVFFL